MQFKIDRWKLFLWSLYNFSVLKFIYDNCKFQFSSYKHQLLHIKVYQKKSSIS